MVPSKSSGVLLLDIVQIGFGLEWGDFLQHLWMLLIPATHVMSPDCIWQWSEGFFLSCLTSFFGSNCWIILTFHWYFQITQCDRGSHIRHLMHLSLFIQKKFILDCNNSLFLIECNMFLRKHKYRKWLKKCSIKKKIEIDKTDVTMMYLSCFNIS